MSFLNFPQFLCNTCNAQYGGKIIFGVAFMFLKVNKYESRFLSPQWQNNIQRLYTELYISWFLIMKPFNVGKCKFTEKEWCFLLSISFSQWSLRDLPFRNRQRNVSRFIFNLTVQMWLIKQGNMLCRSKCWNLICCEQTKTNEVSTFRSK